MNTFQKIALILAMMPIPAHAGTILPNLYAAKYCQLRSIGATPSDAMTLGLREAMVSGDDWVLVTLNGKQYQSDIVLSAKAAVDKCPEYFR